MKIDKPELVSEITIRMKRIYGKGFTVMPSYWTCCKCGKEQQGYSSPRGLRLPESMEISVRDGKVYCKGCKHVFTNDECVVLHEVDAMNESNCEVRKDEEATVLKKGCVVKEIWADFCDTCFDGECDACFRRHEGRGG